MNGCLNGGLRSVQGALSNVEAIECADQAVQGWHHTMPALCTVTTKPFTTLNEEGEINARDLWH
jgi:hypothetical protein